jgi:Asp-tRNA(Asn)/Glu-tRNA(Gln) amidotransferase C subunit
MSTNKEYRKHPNGEDIMSKLSDIIDLVDDAKEDFRYLENLSRVIINIDQVKQMCHEINSMIIS